MSTINQESAHSLGAFSMKVPFSQKTITYVKLTKEINQITSFYIYLWPKENMLSLFSQLLKCQHEKLDTS